jgi:hypothetical protein
MSDRIFVIPGMKGAFPLPSSFVPAPSPFDEAPRACQEEHRKKRGALSERSESKSLPLSGASESSPAESPHA